MELQLLQYYTTKKAQKILVQGPGAKKLLVIEFYTILIPYNVLFTISKLLNTKKIKPEQSILEQFKALNLSTSLPWVLNFIPLL